MRTRIGIEISPLHCRIVEIEATSSRTGGRNTRVHSYSVSPIGNDDTRLRIASLRGREAAVVVWGLGGDHRQAIVDNGRYDAMRCEALRSIRFAGIGTQGVLADIAPAGPRPKQGGRRPVVMALASKSVVAAALQPLRAAGIKIRSVVTPAAALCSVARLRRGRGALSGIEAYVALEETATCIALVRDQILVAARELPWGYVEELEPPGRRVRHDTIAIRLAEELADFCSAAGIDSSAVKGVCICGAMPELRTMSAAIMERFDVEIEPLDSLFGFDAEHVPPGAELRERAFELRLAWAVAADWRAPLNLFRDRQRRAAAALFARAAVVAGIATGVALGWGVQQSTWLEASVQRPATGRRARGGPPHVELPKIVGMSTMPVVHREPAAAPPPIMREPIVSEPTSSIPESRSASPVREIEPAVLDASRIGAAPRPADVELDSVLFGPDRKLAVIDGRIVEAGDEVSGSSVVEIGPTSVTLRDRAGRVQKLSLGKKRP